MFTPPPQVPLPSKAAVAQRTTLGFKQKLQPFSWPHDSRTPVLLP